MTASSSLTLRTTSDDDLSHFEPPPPPIEIPPKVCSSLAGVSQSTSSSLFQPSSRAQQTPSPSITSIPAVRQAPTMHSQTPPNVPSPPTRITVANPDKIRPLSKTSTRPAGPTRMQSPMKPSSTTSSINTDVPQIEIISPSPNSPGMTAAGKSKSSNRDPYEAQPRFGYDAYMKQQDDPVPQVKSPNTLRKASKASTIISPVKQRDQSEPKRASSTTPINGNPMMNKTKMSSPRHASTSSEEQHTAPPTPMKAASLREPTPTSHVPSVNSHLLNRTNQPPRLFIALFDYDPNAMSPNKDNEEELPFKEGQLIRVRASCRCPSSHHLHWFHLDLRRSRCRRLLHRTNRERPCRLRSQ